MITELAPSSQIAIPSRWSVLTARATREEVLSEIDSLAAILVKGVAALQGLYLRICDTMRNHHVSNEDAREILSRHFPPPRVSELIKVANAPEEVYRRYRAGFFGFKAALAECRGYRILPEERLVHKRMRRAAERLINLAGSSPTTFTVHGWQVRIEPLPASGDNWRIPPVESESERGV